MKGKLYHERDLADEFIWKDDAGLITKYCSYSRLASLPQDYEKKHKIKKISLSRKNT